MSNAPNAHHFTLDDAARTSMEQSAFNFFEARGAPMRIPPTLYADLKAAGVSMKYMEADPSLEQ